jgi:hypothetical protein
MILGFSPTPTLPKFFEYGEGACMEGRVFEPDVDDLRAANEAEGEGGSKLDPGAGMETLSIHERQAGAADGPLPEGVEVEVTDIAEGTRFGEGDTEAHEDFRFEI